MNKKHTTGPWVAFIPKIEGTSDIDESGNSYWNIEPESFRYGKEYLQLSGWMSEENARLIAAAPELLDALISITQMAESFPSELHKKHPDVIAARAAIAKATGQ
jgi:hypothetical protein